MTKGQVIIVLIVVGFIVGALNKKPQAQVEAETAAAAAASAKLDEVSERPKLEYVLTEAAARAKRHCEYMRSHGASCE